jgi:prophage DNA circulation protein
MSAWRDRLVPASFRGVEFHVELGALSGGRRVVMHEFAKREEPYAEDMGRRARRYPVTGYLVSPEYIFDRDDLIEALEEEGPGVLVHPTLGEFEVAAGDFTCTERRERGGYCEFEMMFLEAGADVSTDFGTDTQGVVKSNSADAEAAAKSSVDGALGQKRPGQVDI